jgi:hypothetical protein
MSQPWSTPVKIITHSQVLDPDATAGGVGYVRIAAVDSPAGVQVVWEQTRVRSGPSGPLSDSSIWTIAGTTGSGGTSWGAPQRLSPESQIQARRPAVAASHSGQVHFTWTVITQQGTQEIHYRALANPSVKLVNPEPINVTGNFPTFAGSAAVASGNTVCTAWYGYTAAAGTDWEEINLQCSSNGGATWSHVNVSESTNWLSIFPAAALDSSGIMHFAWTEHRLVNNTYEPVGVFYRNSEERGGVFLPLVTRGR